MHNQVFNIVSVNFLEDIALIFMSSAIILIILDRLKIPLIISYFIAGFIIGPFVPFIYADLARIRVLSDLALTVLVFSIGTHFKFSDFIKILPRAGSVSILQSIFMIGLAYIMGFWFHWGAWQTMVTAVIIAISGALVMAKALETQPMDSNVKDFVFGIVIFEDVMSIVFLSILSTLSMPGVPLSLASLSVESGKLILFMLCFSFAGIAFMKVVAGTLQKLKGEILLVVLLGIGLGFAIISERFVHSLIIGAFLAGSLLADSKKIIDIEEILNPITKMFGAIYFVTVGMLFDPNIFISYGKQLFCLTIAVIFGKLIFVFLSSLLVTKHLDLSIKSGFTMAQIGVFSIATAELGTRYHPELRPVLTDSWGRGNNSLPLSLLDPRFNSSGGLGLQSSLAKRALPSG
jgi:monovalent cation:H+ antiporter-2, CPA2 family